MNKRIIYFMAIFVATICTIMMPENVSAAEEYKVRICGKLVTSDNAGDVLGDGTVSYNPTTHTVTLNNAKLVTFSEGVYSFDSKPFTVVLIGDNTVTPDTSGEPFCGIAAKSDLLIKGTGSLSTNNLSYGIYTEDYDLWESTTTIHNITIEDGVKLTFNSTEQSMSVKPDLSKYENVQIKAGVDKNSATVVTNPTGTEYHKNKYVSISPKQAVTKYDLWIGGVQVTSENAKDVLNDKTVSYDESTNTLTLNNAKITNVYHRLDSTAKRDYYYGFYSTIEDLKVKLVGENVIDISNLTYDDAKFDKISTTGFYTFYMNVSGDGSLDVTSAGTGILVANMTMNSGRITGEAGGISAVGIAIPNLTLNGGKITGLASGPYANGVNLGTAVINNGNLSGISWGTNSIGMASIGKLTINGGKVIAKGTGEYSIGYDTLGTLKMTGGNLEVSGEYAGFVSTIDEGQIETNINGVILPEGYEFQTVNKTVSIVPIGTKMELDEYGWPSNAVKEITLTSNTTHEHTWSKEWKSDDNKHWHECECGAKSDEKEHTKKVINAKDATTKEEGYTGDTVCEICGHIISKGKVIPIVKEEQKPEENKPQEEIKNPQTGDNILVYGITFIMSLVSLVFLTKYNLKKIK